MKNSVLAFLLLFSVACHTDTGTPPDPDSCSDLTTGHSGFLQLTDPTERGEKLLIYGKVIDETTKAPIPNTKLFVYQTDKGGNYNSWLFGMPSFASIKGKLKTGATGCFKLSTVVPGNYPGEIDGKHIHVEARARGYTPWHFEFLFEGWINERTRKEVAQNKDAIIIELKEKDAAYWIVQTEVKLKVK